MRPTMTPAHHAATSSAWNGGQSAMAGYPTTRYPSPDTAALPWPGSAGSPPPPPAPVTRPGDPLPLSGLAAPGADAPAPIDAVVAALKQNGEAAGLAVARRFGAGMVDGAQAWIKSRAWTEEQLAAEIARLRALRAKAPGASPDLRIEFLEKRIAEVRAARAKAQTPPQAVADLPEVARHGIPPWVSYAGLGLAALSLLYAITRPGKGKE